MEHLFSEFPAADATDWKTRLEKDLKGITFDQLSAIDRNGINIYPFYTAKTNIKPLPVTGINPGWDICAMITAGDAHLSNKAALHELNNGATGIFFDIRDTIDINLLLKGIELSYIYSCFRIGIEQESILQQLKQLPGEKDFDLKKANTFLYHDFISNYSQTGADKDRQAGRQLSLELFKTTSTIGIDADIFLNAGATTVYELACVLASVNEYLYLIQETSLQDNFRKLHITLSTNTDFFEQISKLRALRKLLQLLCDQYSFTPQVHIHVTTAQTYRSPFDSYSNLLRDTISGMAAVIGGCDSLYIHPFNESVKPDDDFGCRMSRNQQLIFREESYLDKVADVATGSYYIETLTDKLAHEAWEQFKNIESDGGFLAAFDQGIITLNIRQQAGKLIDDYRTGKRVLIGVNKFLNPKDQLGGYISKAVADDKIIQPLSLTDSILEAH